MKKVLLIETLSEINGGQKMSLIISDILRKSGEYQVFWSIPENGTLSSRLVDEKYNFFLMGDVALPAGKKGKRLIFKYFFMSIRCIKFLLKIIKKNKIDIIYAPGPAALPWSAIIGFISKKPVVWHLHHIFLDGPTKKLLSYFSKWRSVKKIIAVSNVVGKQAEAPEKTIVLYNPVDFEKYNSGHAENIDFFNCLKEGGL